MIWSLGFGFISGIREAILNEICLSTNNNARASQAFDHAITLNPFCEYAILMLRNTSRERATPGFLTKRGSDACLVPADHERRPQSKQ